MKNVMDIKGYRAVIQFDPDINMFRGEFVGLNGGADFYSESVCGLQKEGEASLKVFLEMCKEKNIAPTRTFSGKLQVRLPEPLHERATEAAQAKGISLNQFIIEAVHDATQHSQ